MVWYMVLWLYMCYVKIGVGTVGSDSQGDQ